MSRVVRLEGGMRRLTVLLVCALALSACGDQPLGAVGERSSEWLAQPTITTTTTVATTVPVVIGSDRLEWFNSGIGAVDFLDDPGNLTAAIFARRGGDRFIQADPLEIVALIPDVLFPASVPHLSRSVTSQLVFNNDGQLADDPAVAFGIWSSEPYSRSRSVAQMVVIRVSLDAVEAGEVSEPGADLSCERFTDRSTEECEVLDGGERPMWSLQGSSGRTVIFYDQRHRYEVFARTFVPNPAIDQMVASFVPLAELLGGDG